MGSQYCDSVIITETDDKMRIEYINEGSNILEINKTKTEKTYEKYNSTLADFQKEKLDKKLSEMSENIGFSSVVSRIVLNALHNQENSDDDNILDSTCYKLNMSRWTLNRHLHLEGVSFQSILKEIRMKEACRLLKESNLTLQEISEIIGFSSQSTFTRFFKGQLDVNPSNFRKNN